MKIVQTNKAYYPKVGGIETTITTLSEGLVNYFNADVKVLTCSGKKNFQTEEKKINGVNIKYLSTFEFLASLPISPNYFKEIRNYSGDILHIHEPFPLADIALLTNSKIKNNFSKIVVSWHSDIVRQKWVLSFYKNYLFKFLENVDKIIVSNPNLIQNSDFLPSFKNKIEIIPIGVNLNWVEECKISNKLSEEIKKSTKGLMALFVGRLVYYKGIEYLIDAINLVQDITLIIIGSGPLKDKLERKIIDLNLSSRIKIIPEVDEVTLHGYYKSCDIFILPSVEKSETYGIVQIEAMACGKPVICTEIGTGTTFINQNEITGLVVSPRNSKALVDAILKLTNNLGLRQNLGNLGKQRAFKEFSAKKMVKTTFELYKNLLENK
ncbi:MAG: glycosyltransferase [Ignavibacteriae bacterium]|nr:glycosyltransferase [Ignavibacteriota bacterium]